VSGGLASRILHCDAACVVVNKIAGEAVEGAGKNMADLPRLLAAELSAPEYPPALPAEDVLSLPCAVHRLDVPVSGCAVFARTGAALGFLNNEFKANNVKKNYWAVVEQSDSGGPEYAELVHWLEFNPRNNKSFAYNEPGPGRKKAVLRYRLAGRGEKYLFLEIELVTGRHHQIRAQLERLGLRVKGDLKYGARRSEKNGGIRLHARSISFPDPSGNDNRITVQADPPLQDNLWLAAQEWLLSIREK
jgi:23S rRNA pseudouridine1911/1915/1917 synthase